MKLFPIALTLFFVVTAILARHLLFRATRSNPLQNYAAAWMLVQSVIALTGFYTIANTVPPRLALALVPPALLAIAAPVFFKPFIAAMDLRWTVLFHTIRILVELNLYWLFLVHRVPRLLTFEGGNLDILVGLTAPVIWWLYSRGTIARTGLLVWNALALLSLCNAVGRALLSAPFRFQHFGFSQPNVAIFFFPFILLPAFIVPAALFCHLAIFQKLYPSHSSPQRF